MFTTETIIEIFYKSYPAELTYSVDENNITISEVTLVKNNLDMTFLLEDDFNKNEFIDVCRIDHNNR